VSQQQDESQSVAIFEEAPTKVIVVDDNKEVGKDKEDEKDEENLAKLEENIEVPICAIGHEHEEGECQYIEKLMDDDVEYEVEYE